MQNHEEYIKKVNALAWQSAQQGFDPFAAILVKDGEIKAQSTDKCIIYSDPTAHAELALISDYCRERQLIYLEGYTLYSNVEPCVMCSGAIHWARVSSVVFGLAQSSLQKKSGGNPKPSCSSIVNMGGKKVEVIGPILPELCMELFEAFPFSSKLKKHQAYYGQKKDAGN